MSVYDVFADKYIDELDIDPIAPPERYKEITEELLIQNAARWFAESFTNKAETIQLRGEQDE